MNNTNSTSVHGGISFTGALAILFIGLKLLNVIDWPWIWVLSPIWIPVICLMLIGLVLLVIYLKAK